MVGAIASAEGGQHVVRIRRQAEAGRDPRGTCRGGPGQRARVRHPQVEQVDATTGCDCVRDATLDGGQVLPQVVDRRRRASLVADDDRGERRAAVVGHGRVAQRVGDGAPPDGQDMLDAGPIRQRPGERDEQARHATDVRPAAEAQLAIDARRHRQLRDAQPGATGVPTRLRRVHLPQREGCVGADLVLRPRGLFEQPRHGRGSPRRCRADGGDPCGTALASVGRDASQERIETHVVEDADEVEQASALATVARDRQPVDDPIGDRRVGPCPPA